MPLPFDARKFFEVFARYNTAVWPAQIVLQLAALSAVALAVRPGPGSDRAIGVILGSLWLWMGGVYHLVFFRSINPAASLFGALFLLEGLLLLGVAGWRERLHFVWTPTRRGTVGAAFLAYALVLHPMLASALGHRYPATPTFGLPCPTAIFTLGLLVWVAPPPTLERADDSAPLVGSRSFGRSAARSVGRFRVGCGGRAHARPHPDSSAAGCSATASLVQDTPNRRGPMAPNYSRSPRGS